MCPRPGVEGFPARAWKFMLLVLFSQLLLGRYLMLRMMSERRLLLFLLLRLLWRRLQTAAAAGACLKKSRSKSIRDELGQRQNGQNGFRLITGGIFGDCKVTLATKKKMVLSRDASSTGPAHTAVRRSCVQCHRACHATRLWHVGTRKAQWQLYRYFLPEHSKTSIFVERPVC